MTRPGPCRAGSATTRSVPRSSRSEYSILGWWSWEAGSLWYKVSIALNRFHSIGFNRCLPWSAVPAPTAPTQLVLDFLDFLQVSEDTGDDNRIVPNLLIGTPRIHHCDEEHAYVSLGTAGSTGHSWVTLGKMAGLQATQVHNISRKQGHDKLMQQHVCFSA